MATARSIDRTIWSEDPERRSDSPSGAVRSYNMGNVCYMPEHPGNMPIDIALKRYCGIGLTAYALVGTSPDGQVATFFSDRAIAKYLFTAALQNESLIASGHQPPHPMPTKSFTDNNNSANPPTSPRSDKCLPIRSFTISDDAERDKVYRRFLMDMQQDACKILGKAWVKLLEPKKQSTYPYAKGTLTGPPWWPKTIRHDGPDHLHVAERMILLMRILGLIANQDPNGPIAHRKLDVAQLEEATRDAMASWFTDRSKPKNAEKRNFLNQLFRLLYKEERYRLGQLDGFTTVFINDLTGLMDHNDGDDNQTFSPSPQQHHQARIISPFPPTALSSLPPSHPITTTASAAMQVYPPHLQPRSSSVPATPDTAEEYTEPTHPFYNRNAHSHHQQAPTCTSRARPALTATPLGSIRQFSIGMPTSSLGVVDNDHYRTRRGIDGKTHSLFYYE